jgi:transposase
MRRNSKYVGLDVHQAMTAATVRTESGRVIVRSVIETNEPSITEFFSTMRGTINVAFEEGTQAQWLYDLLRPRVDRVIVCDVRGKKRSGNKGDQIDADDLSQQLRVGGLRAVYHGSPERADLKELTRAYRNLVDDSTRVMLRLKALFRARAIRTTGGSVYDPTKRGEWVAQLSGQGAQLRASTLYAQLDVLKAQRKTTKSAMVTEAKRDPAWAVLETIPYYGPVRIALLLATIGTPWRFRSKRNLWAYSGLAVVTHTSSEYEMVDGHVRRRRRTPLTRGLNRNHNRVLKNVFKGAATAATARPGPLQDLYHGMLERGMRKELARVTLARKIAALTLRLLKTGEVFDPTELTRPQT